MWIVMGLLMGTATVQAMRTMPSNVAPVSKDGIRYEAPIDAMSPHAIVQAWDEKTNKKLWEKTIFTNKENPRMETDYIFIRTLQIDGNKLIITDENKQQYQLDLKTLAVSKVKKEQPAPQK